MKVLNSINMFRLIEIEVERCYILKYKLIAAGIFTGSLLSYSSNIFANAHKFPDIPEWANVSVNYLVGKRALHGKPNGIFAPSETIDRGSAAKIIAIVLGLKIN